MFPHGSHDFKLAATFLQDSIPLYLKETSGVDILLFSLHNFLLDSDTRCFLFFSLLPEWMKLDSHCPERSRFLQAKSTPERFCFLPFIPFGRSRIPKSGRPRPPLLGFGSPRGGDDGTIDVVDDRVLGKAPRRALPPAERPELRRGDGGVHPVAPGTRAGGEVPEEGLGLEHTRGKGCVHRCPGCAVTDAGVGGHGARSSAEGKDGKNTTQRERIGSRKPRGRRGWEESRRGGSRGHGWKGAEGA
uniref:Uncharacterized protein n=1 Tax=Zea mays TaxID=4577 RepID=C4J1N2_MAIZE|nr:unknown [Zea mays]